MKALALIQQTVQATEAHLFEWLKLDSNPYDDLVSLAGHHHVKAWDPGTLAQVILDASIQKFGDNISDDMNIDLFDGDLKTGELSSLQYWIDSLGEAEGLLMDQVLWFEMDQD